VTVLGKPRIALSCVLFSLMLVHCLALGSFFFLSSYIVVSVPFLFSTKERNCSLLFCPGLVVRERGVA